LLDEDVEVGPYSVIGAGVILGAGTRVGPHVVIGGATQIGRNNHFHPFASIGGPPQDKKYRGEPTSLVIGDGNTFRESVTVNRGTIQDKGVTRIGSDNWVMAYVHIAHDCTVGDHTIFANTTNLAGTVVLQDIPPYVMTSGNSAQAHGINTEGLKRRGFSAERIQILRRAYRLLYKSGLTFEQARSELSLMEIPQDSRDDLMRLAQFLERVTRGIVR
jgi:UDP-N-acetylglucosamine acyltransferase